MPPALRQQMLGQRLPLTASPKHVEDGVQNLAYVDRTIAFAMHPCAFNCCGFEFLIVKIQNNAAELA